MFVLLVVALQTKDHECISGLVLMCSQRSRLSYDHSVLQTDKLDEEEKENNSCVLDRILRGLNKEIQATM